MARILPLLSAFLLVALVVMLTNSGIACASVIKVWSDSGCSGYHKKYHCGCHNIQYNGGYKFRYNGYNAVFYSDSDCSGSYSSLDSDTDYCNQFDWKSVYLYC